MYTNKGFVTTPTSTHSRPRPRTLDAMITAGRYIDKDRDITVENFPVQPDRYTIEEAKLVEIRYDLEQEEILYVLDQRGLRPGIIEELLAYGEENPEQWCTIFALGSSYRPPACWSHVPGIVRDEDGDRHLSLIDHDEWSWLEKWCGTDPIRLYLAFPK